MSRNINVLALAATLAIAAIGIGYEYVTFGWRPPPRRRRSRRRVKNAEARLERLDDENAAGAHGGQGGAREAREVIRLTASVNQQFALLQQAAFHATTATRPARAPTCSDCALRIVGALLLAGCSVLHRDRGLTWKAWSGAVEYLETHPGSGASRGRDHRALALRAPGREARPEGAARAHRPARREVHRARTRSTSGATGASRAPRAHRGRHERRPQGALSGRMSNVVHLIPRTRALVPRISARAGAT